MVSGGVSVGFGIKETAIKEAAEEASIPESLAQQIVRINIAVLSLFYYMKYFQVSAGCVSFFFESQRGLFPNTEFVYDLELPLDFVPNNADGEVSSVFLINGKGTCIDTSFPRQVQKFELLPAAECLERVFSPEFKTTSCPVIIDFLIRHGFIGPENEPKLTEIVELLHVPLCNLFKYARPKTIENGEKNGQK